MISESRLREAAFWDEEGICLACGVEAEEGEPCGECGSDLVVRPAMAVLVLDNVEEGEE